MHEGELGIFNCGEADHCQIGNMLFDNLALKTATSKPEIDLNFVVEKFIINPKVTQSPWTLETTGLIRYFAFLHHIPLHFQTSSQAKNLIPKDIIKKVGLYTPGQPHAMDAVSHALFFLVTKKGLFQECLT